MKDLDFKYLNQRFDRLEAMFLLVNARVELLQKALVDDIDLILENRGEYEADIARLNLDVKDILAAFQRLDDREVQG